MANHLIDLTGKRFGRLTVIERAEDRVRPGYKAPMWKCKCDCGKVIITYGALLRKGLTRSCGCYAKERLPIANKKYEDEDRYLVERWRRIKGRCSKYDPVHRKNYYCRGIKVCKEWENDFYAFKEWAIHNGYSPELTIDRIDNDKGYSPDNCRWIPEKEQHRNVRSNHIVEYNGEKMPLVVAAEIAGVRYDLAYDRIRHGWDINDALTRPLTYKRSNKYADIYRS